jgi:hypothetical protein
MMNDIDLARLRRLASGDPVLIADMPSSQLRDLIGAALEEIDDYRETLGRVALVRAQQCVDDERWRQAEPNRPRDRVMWEGIAADIGKQILRHAACSVRAGGGLMRFEAAVAIVTGPAPGPAANLLDMGGFVVRVLHDNRAEIASLQISAAAPYIITNPEKL